MLVGEPLDPCGWVLVATYSLSLLISTPSLSILLSYSLIVGSPVLYNSDIFQHNANKYFRSPCQAIFVPLQVTIIVASHEQKPFNYFSI